MAATVLDPRTQRLLQGPIVTTLLRMAAPNVLVMVAQAAVGLIETWFVGKLGTDALAGMALTENETFTRWLVERTPSRRWARCRIWWERRSVRRATRPNFVNGHILYVHGGVTATL